MKAIILAAGRGSRMKNLTDDQPKCLVSVRGRTLLEWQVQALREAGIEEIAIVTGYRREALANRGLTEFHNARWAQTNMVSSLACAESWLLAHPCIVSYSDIFYHVSAVRSLAKNETSLALTYDPRWLQLWKNRFGDPLLDAETFRVTPEGVLTEIGNRPKSVDEVQGQYMGLLRFSPKAWTEVQRIRAGMDDRERDSAHMTGTLQRVIAAGQVSIHAISYEGDWGEVDSVSDLALYQAI